MNATVIFSKADVQQVKMLQKLSIATFSESFGTDNTVENLNAYFEQAFSLPSLHLQLSDPESSFYFIYHGEESAGYFKINIGESQTEMKAKEGLELERIYILKKLQRKGFGKKIMEEVKRIAIEKDKKYIWLGVWEHNEKAKRFYESCGFHKFNEHDFLVGDDIQTDWMMRLEI